MDPREFKKYLRKAFAIYPRVSRKEIDGFTPSFIVGEKGYPKVRLIFGVSEDKSPLHSLFGNPMDSLIENRLRTVGAVRSVSINESVMEEIALSVRVPETETELESAPRLRIIRNLHSPVFLSSGIKSIRVVSFRIPEKLEKIVSDEIRADEAVRKIYGKYGIYKAIDALSGGFLGTRRRIVPSRWAITAADDIVGRSLMREVLGYRRIRKPEYFRYSYLDNDFLIALLPGPWSFELVEKWRWLKPIHDFEGPAGRSSYASATQGAYYAARLAALEYLSGKKRQASVIVLRKIGKGYSVPMGVWVIRETVREAFSHPCNGISPEFAELWESSSLRKAMQTSLLDF